MYESKSQPPLPWRAFRRRLLLHGLVVSALVAVSLLAGVAGHVYFEQRSWHDAFLNAAVTLAGMGIVDLPRTVGGKVFASLYALYAGLVFLAAAGTVLAPVVHRLLHKFHWDGP